MHSKDLKKEIKKALNSKKLLVNNAPVAAKKKEVDAVIHSVIRKVASDEVKREIIKAAEEKSGVVFKFYRSAIRGKVNDGSKEVAAFLEKGFELKSMGMWELKAEITDNRWDKPATSHKFSVGVGIPKDGEIVISKIPDSVVDFIISRRNEEEKAIANAKAFDNYLSDIGVVSNNAEGIAASVKLKGMLE